MFRRVVAPSSIVASMQMRCIYQYKFGQSPLTEPFVPQKGIAHNAEPSVPTEGKVEVTRLPNGTRVVSQNNGGPLVSVGAYVLAGPVYDPANCPGVGAMMHLALTTSNYNNSLFQLDRNIRSVGAAQEHFERFKHFVGLRIDCRADVWKSHAQRGASIRHPITNTTTRTPTYSLNLVQDNIFTCLAAPRFHETDIERFRDTIDNQLKELRWQSPAEYAIQHLETVAFYRAPLGNPRFVPENNNSNITSKVLLDQYSRYVVPSRIVIAGVNVEHAALVAEYENCPYPHSAAAPHHQKISAESALPEINIKEEKKQYSGGELQEHEDRAKEMGTKPDMDGETICAVGWLANGRGNALSKDYTATLVFRSLLDNAFKTGYLYSKDESHVHEGVRAFYNPYCSAGLIGFTAVAEPQNAVKILTEAAQTVKAKAAVSPAELELAKSLAVTRFLNENADSVRDYCDFLGTSMVAEKDNVIALNIADVVNSIRSVTAEDVKKVAELMFSAPSSFYAHGETLGLPSKRHLGL